MFVIWESSAGGYCGYLKGCHSFWALKVGASVLWRSGLPRFFKSGPAAIITGSQANTLGDDHSRPPWFWRWASWRLQDGGTPLLPVSSAWHTLIGSTLAQHMLAAVTEGTFVGSSHSWLWFGTFPVWWHSWRWRTWSWLIKYQSSDLFCHFVLTHFSVAQS